VQDWLDLQNTPQYTNLYTTLVEGKIPILTFWLAFILSTIVASRIRRSSQHRGNGSGKDHHEDYFFSRTRCLHMKRSTCKTMQREKTKKLAKKSNATMNGPDKKGITTHSWRQHKLTPSSKMKATGLLKDDHICTKSSR
jgi:hypothetical protein